MEEQRCDVLIVGAGPAGLAAADITSAAGLQVVVLDDNPQPGGQIWRDGVQARLPGFVRRLRSVLAGRPTLRQIYGAKVVAPLAPAGLLYETADSDSAGVIRYQRLILCCGARERLLPFPGWTLPGVTGAGGLQALIKQGLPLAGRRVVIAGSGPLLLAVAKSVRDAGGRVLLVAEQASETALLRFILGLWRWPGKIWQALRLSTFGYRAASRVVAASGCGCLQQVTLQRGRHQQTVACDWLACGYGLLPNSELARLLGCQLEQNAVRVDQWQQTSVAGILAAGECCGVGGSELAWVEGQIAGQIASGQLQLAQRLFAEHQRWQRFARQVATTFTLRAAEVTRLPAETLLCRCEDVSWGEVSGWENWRQAKLATRCGMGACQGKICAAAAQHLTGWPLPEPRIPLVPCRVSTLLLLGQSQPEE